MLHVRMLRRGRMGVSLLSACVLLSAWFGMVSCGRPEPPPSAAEVLTAMQKAAETLPAGMLYDRGADAGAEEYLSSVLFAALYGPAARNCFQNEQTDTSDGVSLYPMANDGAVYLSLTPHPAELTVLRCPDPTSALSAAALCGERLELLRAVWGETDYSEWIEAGRVTVVDGFVLFAVCPDAEEVLRAGAVAVRRKSAS